MKPDLLGAAERYAARGLSVIPTRGKLPACRSWKPYQTAPADAATLRRWFGPGGPGGVTGLAVVLGDVSGGLICRDFDTMDGYRRWAAGHRDLAKVLPTVATRRGFHVYARCPGLRLRRAEAGELRAAGGYTLLPPSVHPDGGRYVEVVPFTDAPPPVLDPAAAGLIDGGGANGGGGLLSPDPPEPAHPITPSAAPPARPADDATESTESTETTDRPPTTTETTEAMVVGGGELAALIEAAIDYTQPATAGVRNREVFELARALKALPGLADAPADSFKAVVREWHRRARQVVRTKAFEETWIDFNKGWRRVRYPRGVRMTEILERARAADPPAAAADFEQDGPRVLACLCRELQRLAGEGPFFLSCRTAGNLLGVDHTTAWRWLYLLVVERVIRVEERGGQAHNRAKATRFRYVAPD